MSKSKTAGVPPDKLALYETLIATRPGVERKGATMPYTSLDGHMFSFLTKTGTLALRLPAEQRTAFLETYNTRLCEQYGTVMKEYVEVPDHLLENTDELKTYFDLSHAYVASLKPKPTTRKKKTAQPGKKKTAQVTKKKTTRAAKKTATRVTKVDEKKKTAKKTTA